MAGWWRGRVGLKALLDPDWFVKKGRLVPHPARPPPKLQGRFDVIGSLPPDMTIKPVAQGEDANSGAA